MAKVTLTKGGPHLVEGCDVFDADGKLLVTGSARPCALCACGRSGNVPFCDGSHAKPRAIDTESPTAPHSE